MQYETVLAQLYERRRFRPKESLEQMERLLALLGHPERRLGDVVHIAGTNGKGSTARLVAWGLAASGRRAGLFTSPFIVDFRERISINGEWIAKEEVLSLLRRIDEAARRVRDPDFSPTFFECVTAMAMLHFADTVDCAVLETGLGGRLDATNTVSPRVCAITSISLDHERVLGDSLEAIAREKCGIIKAPAVVHRRNAALRIIRAEAAARGVPLLVAGDYDGPLGLEGAFQRENAGVASAILGQLGVQDTSSFSVASWPGRLERFTVGETTVLLDCAHNPGAVTRVAPDIELLTARDEHIILFGCSRDKDGASMRAALPRHDRLVQVSFDGKRSRDGAPVATVLPSLLGPRRVITVLGSCFLVSEARRLLG